MVFLIVLLDGEGCAEEEDNPHDDDYDDDEDDFVTTQSLVTWMKQYQYKNSKLFLNICIYAFI